MEIDFDKMQGLAPAVVQDADTGELLMVGFMNRESLDQTLRTGQCRGRHVERTGRADWWVHFQRRG